MRTMFGIELNDIQYGELEFVYGCTRDGSGVGNAVEKRIRDNGDLCSVYFELDDKGITQGVRAYGMYLCHGLTSDGKRFIPELAELEAKEATIAKRENRNKWADRAFGFLTGLAVALIPELILRFVIGV